MLLPGKYRSVETDASDDGSSTDAQPARTEPQAAAVVRSAPLVLAIIVALLLVEGWLQRPVQWRPLLYGALAFVCAWCMVGTSHVRSQNQATAWHG